MDINESARARFWSKVDRTSDCWMWVGGITYKGYGRFCMGRFSHPAHRISYEIANGPIPDGLLVDHMCHVRACVNPAHLRLVTNKQNLENHSGPNRSNRSSGVRGVAWHRDKRVWRIKVTHHGIQYNGGSFRDLEEAAEAVRQLRLSLHTHNDLDRKAG